jgi:hypothetical protein
MVPPIYVYYKLDDFYQNHRRLVLALLLVLLSYILFLTSILFL